MTTRKKHLNHSDTLPKYSKPGNLRRKTIDIFQDPIFPYGSWGLFYVVSSILMVRLMPMLETLWERSDAFERWNKEVELRGEIPMIPLWKMRQPFFDFGVQWDAETSVFDSTSKLGFADKNTDLE